MPSKYSHSYVLSQYSSQGLISLPNDQQLDYFGRSRPTEQSDQGSRNRAGLSGMRASARLSLASSTSQPIAVTAPDAGHQLTSRNARVPHRRLLITESDSEDDQIERKPTGDVSLHRQPTAPDLARKIDSEILMGGPQQTCFLATSPYQISGSPAHRRRQPHRDSGLTTSSDVPRRRPQSTIGVKAFMQARYATEAAGEMAELEDKATDADGFAPVTVRDFIKAENPRMRPRPDVSSDKGPQEGLSMREFMSVMPEPQSKLQLEKKNKVEADYSHHASSVQDIEEIAKRAQVPRNAHTAKLPPGYRKASPASAQKASSGDSETQGSRGRRMERTRHASHKKSAENGPSHDSLTKRNDFGRQAGGLMEYPGPPRTKTRETSQSSQVAKYGSKSRTKPASMADVREMSLAKSQTSHQSDTSSIFGLTSAGNTSASDSRPSPHFPITPKRRTSHSWNLPRIEQESESSTGFNHFFVDINDKSTILTSDEDETSEVEEHPKAAPQSQTLYTQSEKPRPEFGIISASRDPKIQNADPDVFSVLSAVFPPDIGRYKQSDDGLSSFAAMKSSQEQVLKVPKAPSTTNVNKLRKPHGSNANTSGGLLRKLGVKKQNR